MTAALEDARLARAEPNWPIVPLKHVAQLVGGGTPSKDNEEFWTGGAISWVSPKDMKRRVIDDTEDHITEAAVMGSATSYVDEGSPLIVVRSGILRHTLPVAIAGRRLTLNQDMKAFRLSNRLSNRFLAYWIEGQSAELLLEWRQFGATVESIDTTRMMNGRIAIPDLRIQRAIAGFLDRETARIDQLIEKKGRMVEEIDQRAISLTWTLVTGRDNPVSPTVNSGFEWIGAIPASWRAVRIKTVARLESGHTPSRSNADYWANPNIPWVSLADSAQLRRTDVIIETKYMISEAGLAGSSARILPAGTVAFTRDATVGLAAILGRDMAVSQHLVGWVCGPELDPKYLLHVIYAMQHELNRLTWGATIKTIRMPDLGRLSCPLPPLDEQRQIIQKLEATLGSSKLLRTKLTRSIELLRELRSALITAAVTGQIDVVSWGRRGETHRRLEAIEHAMDADREEAAV